jgi:hypothetical protein
MQTIIKPTVGHSDGTLIGLSRIIAKLRSAMEIPVGYQDETGFNFGAQTFWKGGDAASGRQQRPARALAAFEGSNLLKI